MTIQEASPGTKIEHKPHLYVLHEVKVDDAFHTGERERITRELESLIEMGFYGNTDIATALQRTRKSAIDFDNPATQELIKRVPGVEAWLNLVPTPAALTPLYNPALERLPRGEVIGGELRKWLIEIADARGMRYRASMVTNLMVEIAEKHSDGTQQQWLSVASGAAQPVLEAAHRVAGEQGQPPLITLADLSGQALKDAGDFANAYGLGGQLRTERMNVLRLPGLDTKVRLGEAALHRLLNPSDKTKMSRGELPAETYHIVEAVGILEYMKPEDWPYRYNKIANLKTMQAGAVTFLRNCYDMVKPGGDLIVGNMLDTHPQLGFTLNVVQWPHVQPRSIEQMMDIFQTAGFENRVEVYVPDDEENRVYALYRIHKPDLELEAA